MKITVRDKGHRYRLHSYDDPTATQELQFIKKDTVDGKFQTVEDGTTNEAVLEMLLNRLRYLNQKAACRENSIAVTKLEEALMWLERRTADRKGRRVEGTRKP